MPYPEVAYGMSKPTTKITVLQLWPDILSSIKFTAYNGSRDYTVLLQFAFNLTILLLALTVFLLIPAWKLLQSSVLIRYIPATILLIGFSIHIYFLVYYRLETNQFFTINLLTASNTLTTALSLLCFKNEWTEPETPH